MIPSFASRSSTSAPPTSSNSSSNTRPNRSPYAASSRPSCSTGARHSQQVEANLQLLKTFFAPLQSLPFDDRSAEEAGQIRADLAAQGTPIGPNDLLIAAIARAHDAILVTHNHNEFTRVTNLRVVNWESQTP